MTEYEKFLKEKEALDKKYESGDRESLLEHSAEYVNNHLTQTVIECMTLDDYLTFLKYSLYGFAYNDTIVHGKTEDGRLFLTLKGDMQGETFRVQFSIPQPALAKDIFEQTKYKNLSERMDETIIESADVPYKTFGTDEDYVRLMMQKAYREVCDKRYQDERNGIFEHKKWEDYYEDELELIQTVEEVTRGY